MQATQKQQLNSATQSNGQSSPHDLFALTDEQILEIASEPSDAEISNVQPTTSGKETSGVAVSSLQASSPVNSQTNQSEAPANPQQSTGAERSGQPHRESGQVRVAVPPVPPEWLAQRMKDPWNGDEAREFWQGIQSERQDVAAYREVFAKPEDARALKELYPGGVGEAREVAERARVLDDIDRAYFGTAGKSAQEVSASREQLAQTMMRENPAAFREMVFAGLRALEQSGAQTGNGTGLQTNATPASDGSGAARTQDERHPARTIAACPTRAETRAAEHDAHLSAYASFEKAANEDLERSIGGVISRAIEQALPNVARASQDAPSRAGQAVPLQTRLSAAIRQDVESALKGDRQLGEQIGQILSARRFDSETRAQVVRLIDDRARQLVPSAAKHVLNDWTQTTLAAHRSRSGSSDAAPSRKDVTPAVSTANLSSRNQDDNRFASDRGASRHRVDYHKLSDEQILEL
jgi:hypothetical protein